MGSATRKYKLKWPLSTTAVILPNAQRVLDEIPDPPNDVIASTNDYKSFKKDFSSFLLRVLNDIE